MDRIALLIHDLDNDKYKASGLGMKNKTNFFKELVFRVPKSTPLQGYSKEEIVSFYKTNRQFQKALMIAAEEFYFSTIKKEKLEFGEIVTLTKYLLRNHFRPTPFGLFSGVGIVTWGESSSGTINPILKNVTVGIDSELTSHLADNLLKIDSVKKQIRYYSNPTIYRQQDKIKYINYNELSNVSFSLESIDFNEDLFSLIQKNEGKQYSQLVSFLTNEGYEHEDSIEVIDELIEAGVLFSEFTPSLSDWDNLDSIDKIISPLEIEQEKFHELKDFIHNLKSIREKLRLSLLIENTNLDEDLKMLRSIIQQKKISVKSSFQVDSSYELSNFNIHSKWKNRFSRCLNVLAKLNMVNDDYSQLNIFKDYFVEKYGENEVSILEVFDLDTGLNYPVSSKNINKKGIIKNIVSSPNIIESELNVQLNKILSPKLAKALIEGTEIKLDDNDFRNIEEVEWETTPTFKINFSIIAEDLVFFKYASGPTASNLIGRFGFVDSQVNKVLKDIDSFEKTVKKNAIYANIRHITNTRMINVLKHPNNDEYSIRVFCKKLKKEIELKDLYLKVCDNRLVLLDINSQKEVIPRLWNAYNYSMDSSSLYYFLCDYQFENGKIKSFFFDWKGLEKVHKKLPRVTYENIILSPETWHLFNEDFNHLLDKEFTIWKKYFDLPNEFYLAEGDNLLYIDGSNNFLFQIFIYEIKKKPSIKIIEYLFNKSESYGPNEFLAIGKSSEVNDLETRIRPNIKAKFEICDEWVYFKVYCTSNNSNEILLNIISPVLNRLVSENIINKWFFIRYSDEKGYHLRIRFHIESDSDGFFIYKNLIEEFKSNNSYVLVKDIRLDEYVRELDRYFDIELAENLFAKDSRNIINILNQIDHENEAELLAMAFCYFDLYFKSLNVTITKKLEMAEEQVKAFRNEFYIDKVSWKNLNKSITTLEKQIAPIVSRNKKVINGQITRGVFDDFPLNTFYSLFHMSVNRYFSDFQRDYELIVYILIKRNLAKKVFLNKRM